MVKTQKKTHKDKIKVFLGGTCNESTWRNEMMVYLRKEGIEWFNPVVSDWTEACMAQEIKERKTCDFVLYAITPKMTGVYSIAEVVDDSNKRPARTILVLLRNDEDLLFSKGQWKSLRAVAEMVARNGGSVFYNLESAAMYISSKRKEAHGNTVKTQAKDTTGENSRIED